MSNEFTKEEIVAFDDLLAEFDDELVLSKNVSVYRTGDTQMERANDVIWRPETYIMQSFDGLDQSANFPDATQLSVPATLGFIKSSNWKMDSLELRDALQEKRLYKGAKQKLASDINIAIMNVAALQGTLVVKNTAAPSAATTGGYASVAECDAIMNEQGVQMGDRYAAFSSRVYNGLASDLAERETVRGKVQTAYEKSYIGEVAQFTCHKMDYANRIAAAAGGAITINGDDQYYTPVATRAAATGERSNVDNRYQEINVSASTNVVAGDCFTIPNVYSVHHITKQATSQLKTFRVISKGTGTLVISPPLISAEGGTPAEKQYQNISATPADGATLTWLNVAAADINPFWHKDSLEILPGHLAVPSDAGASVMRGTTENGIEIVAQKQYDIKKSLTFFRCDTFFGVVNKQPEMNGIIIYSQA